MKRTLSAILVLALLSAGLVSCSTDSKDSKDTTAGETTSTPLETEPARENTPDSLPEKMDFGGDQFTILSRDEFTWGIEMGVDELTGDIVNDAIFNRNKQVEERLNVAIDVVKIPGIWGAEQSFNQTVRGSIMAGDNDYDLISGYAYFIAPLATEGLFMNLKNVPHLDFTQPWWSASLSEELKIDDKLYFMSGDLSLTMIVQLMAMYVNQTLQETLDVPDIYQLVLDGKWTYSTMYEIVKGVSRDLNGDSVYDDKDMYGLGFETGNYCNAFFLANDQPITEKGKDGYPQLAINTPKTADIFERMYELLYNNPGVFEHTETQERLTRNMFINGQLLLDAGLLDNASYCRDMKDNFGIIPFPKYDEAQENYYSVSQDAFSLFSIPVTNTRLELVGAVTEAMAAESYRKVTPAYYETALKIKYSRDDKTSQMLDIIRNGAVFDFGFINSAAMGNILMMFREIPDNKSKNFASYYAKKESIYQKGLDDLLAAYKALN